MIKTMSNSSSPTTNNETNTISTAEANPNSLLPLEIGSSMVEDPSSTTTATTTTTTSSSGSQLLPPMARPRRRNREKLEPVEIPVAPEDSPFILGFHEDKNALRRRKMEDAHSFFYDFNNVKGQGFFAVFDGHGGRAAAAWCGDNFHDLLRKNLPLATVADMTVPVPEILDQTFLEADSFLNAAHGIYSGCTAIVALFRFEERYCNSNGNNNGDGKSKESEESKESKESKKNKESDADFDASIINDYCSNKQNNSHTAEHHQSDSDKNVTNNDKRTKKILPVLYTANVGDSRAVICRNGRAIRLSYDHKGSDLSEQQRVKDAGGFIMNERVNGMLAITRALGDAELKEYISGRPYTTETIVREEDEFLILACDGLWDVCGDQQACELIRDMDPQRATFKLVEFGLDNGSFDNMSVLVIRFRHDRFSLFTDYKCADEGYEGCSGRRGDNDDGSGIVRGKTDDASTHTSSLVTTPLTSKPSSPSIITNE